MNDSNTNCPKCASEMEEGFIVDYANGSTRRPSDWVEGAPVKSFWSFLIGTDIDDKRQYQVRTFRCARCGFLESYANEESSK